MSLRKCRRIGRRWFSAALLVSLIATGALGAPPQRSTAAALAPSGTQIVISADDSGPGTLRQAIADAASGDLITFDPSLAGATIGLTSGQLVIDKNLVIDGSDAPGLAVSGGGLSRVFQIASRVEAEFRFLVVTGGRTPDGEPGEDAEGGGGILNLGTLRLVDCLIHDNRTGNGGAGAGVPPDPGAFAGNGGSGGGILSQGTLILEATSVVANQAGKGGDTCTNCDPWPPQAQASHGGHGGGIYSSGALALTDSIVRDNQAGARGNGNPGGDSGEGGGVYGLGALTISATEVVSNTTANGGRGGGIFAAGDSVINASSVRHNATGASFKGGDGAGIFASGALRIVDSFVEYNTAASGGLSVTYPPYYGGATGGPGGDGGGILFSGGDLTILRTVVSFNRAGDGAEGGFSRYGGDGGDGGSGGGLLLVAARVVMADSTLSNNAAGAGGHGGCGFLSCGRGGDGGSGGAVIAQPDVSLLVFDSTLSHNRAGDAGLYCDDQAEPPCPIGGSGGGISNGGSLTMHNATVSGNRSGDGSDEDGRGSGVYNAGSAMLVNSTLVENSAPVGVAGAGLGNSGAAMLQDTLLAANRAGQAAADCGGVVILLGHNLVERSTGCTILGDPATNILDQPALIGPLALNAPGSTETHALLPDSPAIDAGSCSGGLITTDQRGVPRPQGAACDIGAYEYEPLAVDWRPIYLPLVAGR